MDEIQEKQPVLIFECENEKEECPAHLEKTRNKADICQQ